MEDSRLSDSVCPGEQWFFYWKTSAALWEARIKELPANEVIFIPLHWGFHAESPSSWDFGRIHAERDLHRLTKILTQYGRRFCWLLPLTPAPFLINGGVPVYAARSMSVSTEGIHLAAFDQDNKLNKMFSFFEPKVFQAYTNFLTTFAAFLNEANIKAPIWGARFYYHQENLSVSYLADNSLAFDQGFSRYLKQNQNENLDLNDRLQEERLKRSFTHDVQKLFDSSAEEILASSWKGIQAISILGGSPKETIERSLPIGKSQLQYFQDIFHHHVNDEWVSSCLLNPKEKKELLGKLLQEHFGEDEIENRYHYLTRQSVLNTDWRNFNLVIIFDEKHSVKYQTNGLIPFLKSNYKWMYHFQSELDFSQEWIQANQEKIKFFQGASLDRIRFSQILKLFMMGQRVVLDKSNLDADLEKKLHIFLSENNLKIQSVNFLTNINICELGEGRLILFDASALQDNSEREKFWLNLFNYFNLNQPKIIMDNDVFSLWRIRASSNNELNFLDVRRVNLYNPTSYKKKVTIHTERHFAFMKMIDPIRATAKSNSEGVQIELLPNGKIALDFGHYEEAKNGA